jgi:predicted dehydrogenase
MNVSKVVLVGCGGISRVWLREASQMPNLEIAGLIDLRLEAAQQAAQEFGLGSAVVESDLMAVLGKVEPDIVFNCTVPEAHADVSIQALRQGCHVIVEKPMADSMENARQMVVAARDAGRLLAVGQNKRYMDAIRRLQRFVQSGAIGRITMVHSDFCRGSLARRAGWRDQMTHVLLQDMAIHTFDQARYITGSEALSVYCHEWNPSPSTYAGGASAHALFEMTDDIVYSYRGTWAAFGFGTSWESEWRIIGEKGSVVWDGYDSIQAEALVASDDSLEVRPLVVPPAVGDYPGTGVANQIRDFVNCTQTGERPLTSGEDNLKSLGMVFAAIESAETGHLIDVCGVA